MTFIGKYFERKRLEEKHMAEPRAPYVKFSDLISEYGSRVEVDRLMGIAHVTEASLPGKYADKTEEILNNYLVSSNSTLALIGDLLRGLPSIDSIPLDVQWMEFPGIGIGDVVTVHGVTVTRVYTCDDNGGINGTEIVAVNSPVRKHRGTDNARNNGTNVTVPEGVSGS